MGSAYTALPGNLQMMKKTVKEIAAFMREQADNIEQKFTDIRDFDDGLSSAQVLHLFMILAEVLNNEIKEIK